MPCHSLPFSIHIISQLLRILFLHSSFHSFRKKWRVNRSLFHSHCFRLRSKQTTGHAQFRTDSQLTIPKSLLVLRLLGSTSSSILFLLSSLSSSFSFYSFSLFFNLNICPLTCLFVAGSELRVIPLCLMLTSELRNLLKGSLFISNFYIFV